MVRWLSNVFRLGVKELASLASDMVLAFFVVYSFSFSIYSEATGITTDVTDAPIAIVDSDHSALSTRIFDALLQPYFRRPVLIDRSAVDPLMDEGRYPFILDIPPHFEADVLRGRDPAVQLNIDATAMTQAAVGGGYVSSIMQQETTNYLHSRGIERQLPVQSVERALFNPNLEGVWYNAIDALMQNLTMLTILLVGAAVIRERERGTIEHLLVMPVRAHEIAAGKIWANALVVIVFGTLSLVIVIENILHVPIEGSIPLFVAGMAIYLYAIASLGILLGTVANTMPQFALLAMPVFLTLNMLSGGPSPLEAMPEPLQVAMQISPAMHFTKFTQAVLCRGAGFELVWPHLVVLFGLGAIFLALALARFRSMLARVQ
ncbi:ABC transporter permease [Bradyrhizobium sp.]|uniref:ABC transporter permease n=1 Tax=Bradyrhizobium sp. TaxID=376 RepID=UPI00239395C1|nr:ABC transporter permease [Bradyrhizobium sp.]MDE1933829.1 ABC transporter permease [Bradyrhizobium sp.]